MREMKDSGIEWIGQIPKDWSLGRIKYYSEVTLGKMLQNEPKGNFDTNEYYLCAANIGGFTLNLNSIKKMWLSKIEKNKLNLSKGDLLVVEGGDVGSCVYLEKDLPNVYFQNSINRVKSNYKLDIRLIKYILFLAKKVGYIDLICNKATISHLTKEKLEEIFCIVPESKEQQQIADFLDTQCSEIDATAEDIQKEISLLEEYKKSVITEAVTKGLNPDAEMKDSGIEWIGEIPKDWDCKPIRAVFDEVNEKNFLGTCTNALKFTYGNIVRKPNFDADTDDYVATTILNYTVVEPGTIMLNGLNLNFDFVSQRVGLVREKGIITSAYMAFKPNEKQLIDSEFATYLFKTYDGCKAFHNMGGGVRKILNFSELKKYYIPLPNFNEQQQIVDFLDTQCSEIDSLIADKKRQLDILVDYKKSLIYEYVTGKKEVPVNE